MAADGSYVVKAGDTLYGIAFKYGLDHLELARWNAISSPFVIYPGQKLNMRQPVSATTSRRDSGAVQISTVKSPAKSSTRDIKTQPASGVEQQAPATKAPAARPAAKNDATEKPLPVKPKPVNKSAPTQWRWPTKGRVKRAYVSGDPARNGLDIAGKEGQAVTASADGQVVYSGNGLIGYGELIIIKHGEEMLSAYAHNKVRLAHEGDQVTGGQKIAEMGRNSTGDEILHFEIRVRGKPVNPLNYLPKK